jgi:hypothetical protein
VNNITVGDLDSQVSEHGEPGVIYSEIEIQKTYDDTLQQFRSAFAHINNDAILVIETLAPYLNMSEDLSACNASQAQVLYSKLSKGYEVISTLYSKAVYDKNTSLSQWKALRGRCYLEVFPLYLLEKKEQGITIKDTDASREHYLNTHEEVLEAKKQADFFDALVTTLDGWKSKLYSDLTTARNLMYSKRFSDNLSSIAN